VHSTSKQKNAYVSARPKFVALHASHRHTVWKKVRGRVRRPDYYDQHGFSRAGVVVSAVCAVASSGRRRGRRRTRSLGRKRGALKQGGAWQLAPLTELATAQIVHHPGSTLSLILGPLLPTPSHRRSFAAILILRSLPTEAGSPPSPCQSFDSILLYPLLAFRPLSGLVRSLR